ncbi:hypothetical protein JL722_8370 [Aureococcus anophagefferens]|nr:hypothetical protein JL722_8370 [Aureococcus anophagefferens]
MPQRLLVAALLAAAAAFRPPQSTARRPTLLRDTLGVEGHLNGGFGSFSALVFQNEELWKSLDDAVGYTVLAPERRSVRGAGGQGGPAAQDPRNGEVVMQLGAYHVIREPVTADALFESGGVEDGGVLIGGAKLLNTVEIGNCLVHEMDGLCNPKALFRFLGVRIPGSARHA